MFWRISASKVIFWKTYRSGVVNLTIILTPIWIHIIISSGILVVIVRINMTPRIVGILKIVVISAILILIRITRLPIPIIFNIWIWSRSFIIIISSIVIVFFVKIIVTISTSFFLTVVVYWVICWRLKIKKWYFRTYFWDVLDCRYVFSWRIDKFVILKINE